MDVYCSWHDLLRSHSYTPTKGRSAWRGSGAHGSEVARSSPEMTITTNVACEGRKQYKLNLRRHDTQTARKNFRTIEVWKELAYHTKDSRGCQDSITYHKKLLRHATCITKFIHSMLCGLILTTSSTRNISNTLQCQKLMTGAHHQIEAVLTPLKQKRRRK